MKTEYKNYSLSESLSQSKSGSLHEMWSEFIGRFEPYEWYMTLTFREATHPEQADRRYLRFVRNINEALFGKRFRERGQGVYHVRALEWQRRDVIHFHSLMGGGVWQLHRLAFMDLWDEENGYARILPYDSTKGARWYLGKYVVKRGEIDIYLPEWLKLRLADNGQAKLIN